MTVTTRFTGSTLPAGWSQVANGGGSVAVTGGRAVLTATAVSLDTITATSATQNAVCIAHALPGGDVDVAARFDTDIGDRKGDGQGLLVTDLAGGWARFWVYHPNDDTERPFFFIASRPTGGGAGTNHYNQTVHQSPHRLQSGVPPWMRLRYTASSGLWEPFYSTDGATWIAHTSFTRAFSPAQVLVGHTSTAPSTAGSVTVGEVADIRTDGATDLRGVTYPRQRTTVATLLGTDADLAAKGFADDSAGGDTLTHTGTAWRLASDCANVASRARLLYDGDALDEIGALLIFRMVTGDADLFSTVHLGAGAAEGPQDPYLGGHGYGIELQIGTARRPIRVDDTTDGDVASVPGSSGLDEAPYAWGRDTTGPNLATGTPIVAVRLERFGPDGGRRFRVKEWVGGANLAATLAAEPATWAMFDAHDEIERGTPLVAMFSLAHNNPVAPLTGTASLDVSHFEVYELAASPGRVVSVEGSAAGVQATTRIRVNGAWVSGERLVRVGGAWV